MISSISLATCFPKLQPPSFCVEEDCETSLMLHYRSTRKGFTLFVKGNKKHDGVNSRCAKWFTRATGNWFDPKPQTYLCLHLSCVCVTFFFIACWERVQSNRSKCDQVRKSSLTIKVALKYFGQFVPKTQNECFLTLYTSYSIHTKCVHVYVLYTIAAVVY